jgi:hypothetical protein
VFHDLQGDAGGVNLFRHNRRPAPIDEQTVIRLNRDTLYSFAVLDLTGGVTLAVRTLIDPDDPADLAAVATQDAITVTAASAEPFVLPDYDEPSLDETREALLVLARNLQGFGRMFGTRDQVDPVRHLIGTAAGWGGLPTSEAVYLGVDPRVPPGAYTLTMRDVPADAFWSVSVYNAAGYFEPNASGRYNLNSLTAAGRDGAPSSGEVVVRFVPDDSVTGPNTLPVPGEGWNYLARLYRPRAEVLDGRWTLPPLEPVG